jgi:glucan phosphoethanolaminetransferase (alkaline phosphatase superfamily)
MSKDIKKDIMNQINLGKIKMKPKIYFILGSILTLIGLISSVIISTFLIGLIRFSLRAHGTMKQYKFEQIIANFPWWIIVLAILSLIVGIWFIRQYDFSYKKNLWVIIASFILAIILGGLIVDMSGINDILYKKEPMKRMMNRSPQKNPNFQPNWKNIN